MRTPRSGSAVPGSAVLSIAAALAFAAWAPVLRGGAQPETLPTVSAASPREAEELSSRSISSPILAQSTLLQLGMQLHDGRFLFGYIPVGAPPVIRTAALD